MDPISAIGIASAVAQFITFGLQVASRLAEYTATSPQDVPRPLQNINAQLPLLLNSLTRVQSEENVNRYDINTRYMLRGLVGGCLKLVQEVEHVATKLRPQPGENMRTKLKKVLGSLHSEERISEIDRGIQTYIQVLILHQVVNRNEMQLGPPEEQSYFEVKEKRVDLYERRASLIDQLDKCFYSSVRRLKDRPELVLLIGDKGTGKSQLALGFSHEAFDSNQFRTVFWLDASSPQTLRLSLEGASSAVRRKKEGTSAEKLDFINGFLTGLWQPWLLVLDNYFEEAFIEGNVLSLLPQEGYGALLIIPTRPGTNLKAQSVRVPKFLKPNEEVSLREDVTVAVARGQIKIVKDAIAKGFDVNQNDSNNWPFVTRAALLGFEPAVALFLENGANPNPDPTKLPALAWAASEGHSSIVTILLDHEDQVEAWLANEQYVDILARSIENDHIEVAKTMLNRRKVELDMGQEKLSRSFYKCARNGGLELLQLLCSIGAVPKSELSKADALIQAAQEQRFDVVKFLVSEASFEPDVQRDDGDTVLHHVAALQDPWKPDIEKVRNEMALFLISAGASPIIQSKNGETALHAAALRGFLSTVAILMSAGADPTVEDCMGYTPLLKASKYKSPVVFPALIDIAITDATKRKEYYTKTLHFASRAGDRELLVAIAEKVDVNAVEAHSGDTALLLAIKNGHLQVARYLARHGADQNLKDRKGYLPFLLAAEKGLDLLTRDLSKVADVEVTDGEGNTALILAAKKNRENVVKVLLKAGANKDAENKFGETALDIAEEKGLKKVIELLESTSI